MRGRGGGRNRGGSRAPSAPWSRLKPVEHDPLDAIGLPSKGDNRLLDYKTQERYHLKIVERYMTFCSDAGERDELLRRFSSLNISSPESPSSPSAASFKSRHSGHDATAADPLTTPLPPLLQPNLANNASGTISPGSHMIQIPLNRDTKGLSDVLAALRKLREGIVASKRADDFAVQAYLFCIRLSVLVRHPESYHPAILHLLRRIHPASQSNSGGGGSGSGNGGNGSGAAAAAAAGTGTGGISGSSGCGGSAGGGLLTRVELAEVVSYLVLDTACRRNHLAEAYALRARYNLRDPRVNAILDALAHDNWTAYARLKRRVDAHKARLMEFADDAMRRHLLKCFGRTYLSVELPFLEASAGSPWAALTAEHGVGWDLDGEKVVIRKVRGR